MSRKKSPFRRKGLNRPSGGNSATGGCAAAGRKAGREQNLRDLANDEYCTKGRQGRQIVCLIYTFIASSPNVGMAEVPAEGVSGPRMSGARTVAQGAVSPDRQSRREETLERRIVQPHAGDKASVELYQGIAAMPVCIDAELALVRLYEPLAKGRGSRLSVRPPGKRRCKADLSLRSSTTTSRCARP